MRILTLFIAFLTFAFAQSASAATFVSGAISTDTIWTLASSPYVVQGAFSVNKGATLTIEPGVVVKLNMPQFFQEFMVLGSLNALGTKDSPIYFTSVKDDSVGGDTNLDGGATSPTVRDWTSVFVMSGANAVFSNVQIRYAGANAGLNGCNCALANIGGTVTLSETKISDIYGNGVHNRDNGSLSILKSEITGGSEAGIWGQSGSINVSRSSIYQNRGYGINNEGAFVAAAENNWWGDASGPFHSVLNSAGKGNRVSNNVDFIPWLTTDPFQPVPTKPDPVIIIPGILGSYLNRNDLDKTEVWPNILKMLLPGEDSYLNELAMESTGFPNLNNPLLLPTDIFRQIQDQDYFESLITELKNNGYQEGVDLFVFPYDWRWDITQSGGVDMFPTIQSLKEKIDEVKSKTGAKKVDIVAHSMGGILAKYYIKHFGNGSVNKFIDIATPHLGSPNAFKILMYGDDLDIKVGVLGLNSERTKIISQNMPSIYELLPSRNYFDADNPDYSYYFFDADDLDNNDVKGRLDYGQTKEFLKNSGRNEFLLGAADAFHQNLDSWQGADFGVKTYNIVGCGFATIGKILAVNKETAGFEYGLKYINGDATVPIRSAEALSADKTYYINGIEHATMPSANGIRQLVSSILKGTEASFDFNQFSNVRQDKNNCALNGTQVSFHSPVELHIYDFQNRHAGPTPAGDIENQIPGVKYDLVENNKFAFLPNTETYTIVAKATDTGSFNARIQRVENDQITETSYFNEVPLSSLQTNVQINVAPGQSDFIINLDQNGDGVFESQIKPSATLNGAQSQDLVKPETQILVSGTSGENNWYISDVQITLTATDDNSGVLKTEYSLDNGRIWNIYTAPIAISKEGTFAILYKSIDKAGNIEVEKSQQIKIDKTPPETKIFLNPEIFDLEIQGQDALSSTTASLIAKNTYRVKDQAGHILAIAFKKLKDGRHSLHISVESLRYDSNPFIILPKNMLDYEWAINKKQDELKVLEQKLTVKDKLNVHAIFKQKKNETEIKVTQGEKEDKVKEKLSIPGLVIIKFITNGGRLGFDY